MGSHINLPEEQHATLAQCIENIIQGTTLLFPYPKEIEALAQTYASQVIRHLSQPTHEPEPQAKIPSEFANIDINSIEQSEPRSIGGEHLLLQMMHQLQIPDLLEKSVLSKIRTSVTNWHLTFTMSYQ